MLVKTETGSTYRFNADLSKVRREGTHDLRRDEEWLDLLEKPFVQVGVPMYLALEPLGEGNVTYRTTSRVLEVWA